MKTMRWLVVFAGAIFAAAGLHAQYVAPDFFSVDWQLRSVQTGFGNTTSPEAYSAGVSGPHVFVVSVESNSGNLSTNPAPTVGATAGFYSGGPYSLSPNGSDWRLTRYYATSGALLTDFPDATTFTITQNEPPSTNHANSVTLTGSLAPATPYMATINATSGSIIGWSGSTLQVTAGTVLDLTTSTFANWNTGTSALFNHMGLFVTHNGSETQAEGFSDAADPYFSSGTGHANYLTMTNVSIVSGIYNVELEFNAIASIDQTYGTAVALYTSRTSFNIQAVPEVSTYAAILGLVSATAVLFRRSRRMELV